MKGLILKDILLVGKSARILLMIVVGLGVLFFVQGNGSGGADSLMFLMSYMVVMLAMMPIYTISYDEQAKWDRMARALPVTIKNIVLSKYAIVLIFMGGGLLLNLIISLLIGSLEYLPVMLLLCCAGLLVCGIQIPVSFKFGPEKTRFILIALLMLPTIIALGISKMGIQLPEISENQLTVLLAIAAAVMVLLFVGSYFIAVRVYEKKEI